MMNFRTQQEVKNDRFRECISSLTGHWSPTCQLSNFFNLSLAFCAGCEISQALRIRMRIIWHIM